jgi:hypothetical protein
MRCATIARLAAVPSALLIWSCGFLPISTTSLAGTELLEAAPKPPPIDSTFEGCGDAGSQPDYTLNRLKNRVDEGNYLPISWNLVSRLPWPRQVGYRFRHQWTVDETKDVARLEGVAVQVQGYLAGYKLEIPEAPNCYATASRSKDYHLWLSDGPHQPERRSIVVEITPRVRVAHQAWTEDGLAALVRAQLPLRVSGWLMLDQMHPESIGRNRVTLWEIHPIMKLEWKDSTGRWVSLDSLSPARDRLR